MTNGNPKLGNNLRQSLGKLCGVKSTVRMAFAVVSDTVIIRTERREESRSK